MKKKILVAAVAALTIGQLASAQTNFQTFYDFSRKHFTTTLEGYHGDKYGDTFFFVDYDYNNKVDNKNVGVSGSYFEIARGINLWQDSALKDFSAHVEYNGGVGFGNQNFLFGVNYFVHNADFSNTFTFEVLYKTFNHGASSNLPLQFTFVWGMKNFLGIKNLAFSGFADVWGENNAYWYGDANPLGAEEGHFTFLSEPQLWYALGEHMNVGGEVELSYNFAGCAGFHCRPCAGFKWVF